MIDISLYTLFLLTALANISTPGIGYFFLIGISLQKGRKESFCVIVGLVLGVVILQTVALAGLGVIIQSSPSLYFIIKVLGAGFLFYLGIKNIGKKPSSKKGNDFSNCEESEAKSLFVKAVILAIANPQPIVFAISIFPQFISTNLPYTPQVAVMILSYACFNFLGATFYAFLAAHMKKFLSTPKGAVLINRMVGIFFCLIGTFVLYLAIRQFL